MADTKPRSVLRLGCLAALVLIAVAALIGGGAAGVASWQTRSISPEPHALQFDMPPIDAVQLLALEASVTRIVLSPVPAGEALRAEAEFDPKFFSLEAEEGEGALRLRFAPTGSEALALLRWKLGAEPPLLRIRFPADLPIAIEGRLRRSFVAMELGGSTLRSLDMSVDGAVATVSFTTPLASPMDSLRMVGDKGSIEVTGLGNASPASTDLRQRLGEIDLDLRGAWSRDARVRVDASLAYGALWLPAEGVVIEGLDNRTAPAATSSPEGDERPRLELDLTPRGGRLVVLD